MVEYLGLLFFRVGCCAASLFSLFIGLASVCFIGSLAFGFASFVYYFQTCQIIAEYPKGLQRTYTYYQV